MAELDDVKRALVALRTAKARIQELERARTEPIAIVGLSCRYPGGVDGPDTLWELLVEERSGIGPVPADRWDVEAWPAVRQGGFLADIGSFDPGFFGISEREAPSLDPQHRLLLEAAAEAFERAGRPLHALRGTATGVFVGICSTDYAQGTMFSGAPEAIDPYTGTGTAISMAAGRVAYALGLEGPTLAVDTACSSALVATHLACQALRSRECDLALAAGVNVMLSPLVTLFFSRLGVLSRSGAVRAFDAGADGYVRSEGCGAVVLKRLSDALVDRDPILAVIRGSATNQNGRGNGLTSPNGRAQESLLRKAHAAAGITPDQVDYVEAFGGGTPIGDRVEVEALDRVFGPGRDRPLWIGAVKTNLGHAEGASGMASLAKAVLALGHGTIPATRNVVTPNPGIAWGRTPVKPVTATTPWPASGARVAGVSAFGFSGTNAHLVLEAAPAPAERAHAGPVVVALSARSEAAIREHARRVLAAGAGLRHDDVAYTLAARRSPQPYRAAFVAGSDEALRDGLRAIADGRTPVHVAPRVEPTFAVAGAGDALLATLAAWGLTPEPGAAEVTVPGDEPLVVAARLFERGVLPDWEAVYAGTGARAVPLPPSVFERRRYWIDARPAPTVPASTVATEDAPASPPPTPGTEAATAVTAEE
ncbi:MAG: beta-ketoacyl synthase N-terminal-like domain-containing protein, partial [Myxococcota bacterium]